MTTRLPANSFGRDVIRDVQLAAAEATLTGVVRPERTGPGARRVDDVPRCPLAVIGFDDETIVAAPDGGDTHRASHVEGEFLLVRGEIRRQHIPARRVRIGRRHREPGQLVDAVDRGHLQRRPSVLPRSARRAIRVEHDVRLIICGCAFARNESASRKVVRSRQPSLTRTDHDDVDGRGIHIERNAYRRGRIPEPQPVIPMSRVCARPLRAAVTPLSAKAKPTEGRCTNAFAEINAREGETRHE